MFIAALFTIAKTWKQGTSLAVQWLRLHAPSAGGTGSIPGRGSKILCAEGHGQKKNKPTSVNKKKKTWKQPKCTSTDEWIKKMWYVYTMEYYLAIKKNEIMPCATTWMGLETVIQSEVSQKEKNKYHILTQIGRASCRERV